MTSASSSDPRLAARLKARIRTVPDFPGPGVLFRDITPLLQDAASLAEAVEAMAVPFAGAGIDAVVGIESRGFLFGPGVALQLRAGFVPLRKPGKLPVTSISEDYELEYGAATLEAHADALTAGQRVLIADDVLATGGTAAAAVRLCRRLGAEVMGCSFLLALAPLGGLERLRDLAPPVRAVMEYS
jgi:adenine phosphoribosyltransferase